MEVVRAFNNELSSLYEVKPPISKAKMTQITKCAIKGIKFYKHIVQSVEKFIQKCRPEYKVPGLYVVDSIVRQSRHQFGVDKDVFAPRFIKNITATFQNLFKCADEDRPKIVRVLNLWQKNNVFPCDVIQPLLDMANPNTSNEWPSDGTHVAPNDSPVRKVLQQTHVTENSVAQNSKQKSQELSSWKGWSDVNEESVPGNTCFMEMSTRNLEKFNRDTSSLSGHDDIMNFSQVKNQTPKVEVMPPEDNAIKFDKKLLDFDYGDEDEDDELKNDDGQLGQLAQTNALALSMAQNLLSNPELLRQLQQMQQTIQQDEALKTEFMQAQEENSSHKIHSYSPDVNSSPPPSAPSIPFSEPHQPNIIPYQFDSNAIPFPTQQPPAPLIEPTVPVEPPYQQPILTQEQLLLHTSQVDEDERMIYSMPGEPPLPPQDLDERALILPVDDHVPKARSRSRSGSRSRTRSSRHRSRSKSPRRRKSRSRSRSRRNRSRSRERERLREKERERERERERRKKGIPPLKKNCFSVCSTTLWLGHVPKTLSEIDIVSTFGDFGTVLSVDMIPPRGCAYVVMDRRQDAHRALQKLKNLKLQGSSIKMAWAPGKGVKGKEFKEYWEVDLGVSYIPYEKIPPDDAEALDLLEEGGFIDEESIPLELRELRQQLQKEKEKRQATEMAQIPSLSIAEMLGNNPPHPSSIPQSMMSAPSLNVPMVLPQMMQHQFGMPMPGLMPHQMVMSVPMGVPPPNPMMMVQPPQPLLGGQPLPVPGSVPQMPHLPMPHLTVPTISTSLSTASTISTAATPLTTSVVPTAISSVAAGDATPTEEEGTSISSPNITSAVQTLPTVASGVSISVPYSGMSEITSTSPFNPALGLNSVARPALHVPPPISSAGTPIPFPPPHVSFGFPPPPIRSSTPAQGLPPVSLPNTPFPWLHKTSAPPFTAYTDSTISSSVTNIRQVPPALNQQTVSGTQSYGIQSSSDHLSETNNTSVSSSKDVSDKTALTGKDKESPVKSAAYNNRSSNDDMSHSGNTNFSEAKRYGHVNTVSPAHHERNHGALMEMEEPHHERYPGMNPDFAREDAMHPRFPGPPDFRPRGSWEGPWGHGPPPPPGNMQGPRFPRHMHPGSPFPPRGGGPRGMHPRMEMEFFHHQRPPGTRMHMGGPRGPPPRRGGAVGGGGGGGGINNGQFQPQNRNQDWYPPPNRREFFENPPFERDDRDRNYRQIDEWGHGRENWDNRDQKTENEHKWGSSDHDRKYENKDRQNILPLSQNTVTHRAEENKHQKLDTLQSSVIKEKIEEKLDRKKEEIESSDTKNNLAKEKPRTPGKRAFSSKNLEDDLFRLSAYTRGPRPKNSNLQNRNKNREQEPKTDLVKSENIHIAEPCDEKQIPKTDSENINSSELKEDKNKQVDKLCEDNANNYDTNQGIIDRAKRDRDRKRSRWGRTLSEEREFQQQRINEIEMKLQGYHASHTASLSNSNINGNIETESLNVENCNTENIKSDIDESCATSLNDIINTVDVNNKNDVDVSASSVDKDIFASPDQCSVVTSCAETDIIEPTNSSDNAEISPSLNNE